MIVLEIYIDPVHKELKELYKTHIFNHNQTNHDNPYPNSGFDLFIPNEQIFDKIFDVKMVDLQIQTQMTIYDQELHKFTPTGFYLYPRSSIAKTPLLMANNVGVIDSGYRNNVMVALRCFPTNNEGNTYTLQKNTRLVQICHPSLQPIFVQLLEDKERLSLTSRTGGFGSTGIIGEIGSKPSL